jgi:hypothetical protein
VQREPGHAGQGVGVGVQHGALGARVQHQDHRLAQEGHAARRRAIRCARLHAPRAFGLLLQLAQDPALLLAQRGFDLAHAHPARRADAQAFGADDEADAAPAGAAQFVGHLVLAKADLALRARVAEGVGRGCRRRHHHRLGGEVRRDGRWCTCGRWRRRGLRRRRGVVEQGQLRGRRGCRRHGPRF